MQSLLLGFRQLRERDYYRDDPLVQRALGLQRLPDVSTWTRGLAELTARDIVHKCDLSQSRRRHKVRAVVDTAEAETKLVSRSRAIRERYNLAAALARPDKPFLV